MEQNIIDLKFDKTLSCLAGNPYGESIYNSQVKDKINYNMENMIVFPDFIDDMAVSFIQGFFKNILKETGMEGFKNKINIKVGNEELYDKIVNNIY